jgi:riboflavin kinase / FMN adenylyltransferase
MVIFRSLAEITTPLVNAVATIGNFDGVHLGHREIFRRVKQAARELGGLSVVITFVPHPLKVVSSAKQLRLINTYAEKELLIEASGVDYLVIIPFDEQFATVTARQFVEQVLVGTLGVQRLIIGYDYAFGRNREGNVDLLQRLGAEFGFAVDVLPPIGKGEVVYSSSSIRTLVSEGQVEQVLKLLGRHFSLGGVVVHGAHRGKDLGFPTANVATDKELIPADGVYAVKVKIDEATYDGACNIGSNPTFGGTRTTIEVFIFDFAGELYGRELRIYFVARLRGERKFPDAAALREAIADDVARCREILRDTAIIEYREYLEGV